MENAFTKKLQEFHKEESICTGQYKKVNLNSSQGYIKPSCNHFEDRKVEKDLTAQEKKIVEQNPKMDINQIRKLKSKPEEKKNNISSMEFSTHNSTLFNRVNFNNSNIFNDTVIN